MNKITKYLFILNLLYVKSIFACPACFVYGTPEDNSTIEGMNFAILFMLLVILSILIVIGLFMYNMYKRENNLL